MTSPNDARNLRRMTDQAESFGSLVRATRLKRGITQEKVAAAIGTTIQFISAIENEREPSASPATVIAWADCLGISRRRLLRLGSPTKRHMWESALAKAPLDL